MTLSRLSGPGPLGPEGATGVPPDACIRRGPRGPSSRRPGREPDATILADQDGEVVQAVIVEQGDVPGEVPLAELEVKRRVAAERLVSLCRQPGATRYLSGPSARAYQIGRAHV